MRSACLAGLAVLAAGCASAPVHQPPTADRPEMALPASWQGTPFAPAVPNDGAQKGPWWSLFKDAQLDSLEQQALAHNQSLLVAAAHLEQARALARVSAAGLLPQLGAQAGVARQRSSADRPLAAYGTINQSVVQNNEQAGFTVSYEADLFGRVRANVRSARAAVAAASADLENATLVLQSEIAADYFNLRELDDESYVVQQGIALQKKSLDFITARHDLGTASGLDLAQQQSLLDASQTQLELLRNQRAAYAHALATLIGTPAPQFALAAQVQTLVAPVVPAGLPSDLLQRRPDIASAERMVAVANANIGVARAAYFPTILLQANGGWDSNQISTLFSAPSLLWSLGAALTQSIFDGGKSAATVDFARASYAAAAATYRQSVLTAMQEVQDGVEGMDTLARASAQADASVRSAGRVLELANDRYTGGLDTYLDVITAQQTLLANQRQATHIRGQQMVTAVFLVKALGGGWQGLQGAQQ